MTLRMAKERERALLPKPKVRMLRRSDVVALTGLSTNTLYRLERRGAFPRRRVLGERSVGWLSTEIDAWMASRPQFARGKK